MEFSATNYPSVNLGVLHLRFIVTDHPLLVTKSLTKNKNPPLNPTPVLPMKLETLALAPSNHRIAVVRMINDETRRESREREIESDRGR